ncbi:hypothetical protein PG990_002495 [Apiospora arundinis]
MSTQHPPDRITLKSKIAQKTKDLMHSVKPGEKSDSGPSALHPSTGDGEAYRSKPRASERQESLPQNTSGDTGNIGTGALQGARQESNDSTDSKDTAWISFLAAAMVIIQAGFLLLVVAAA